MMFDGEAFGSEVVDFVKGYLEREVAPLKAENETLKERIAALEARPAPEKGDPGKDADMGAINESIGAMVQAAVANIPLPEDGEDGKDAAGIVEALKDNGELVLTLQDGRLIRTGIRDGEKGKDGRDGFQLEDFDCRVLDDDRTIEFAFKSSEHEHVATLKWPTVIDRGVYRLDEDYDAGDGVTWGGQFYIANEPSKGQKPDQSKDGKPWRLAVRKGRDGKNG